MKKLLCVLLAVTLTAAFLVGCTRGSGSNTTFTYEQLMAKFEGEPENNVTIKVLDNDTAVDEGYFKQLVDAFNAEYAKYGIKAEDANMSQYTDLETNGPLGYGPDVLYDANDVIMRYAENGHVLPLPTEKLDIYKEGVLDSAISQTYEMNKFGYDLQFGVPINVQSLVMYYRQDKLPSDWETKWDANSNDVPDMLETYNGLYAYSKTIRQGSTNDNPVYGFVHSLNNQYFNFGYLLSYGAYIFGDNTMDLGLANGDSYKGLKVMQDLASIMDSSASTDSYTVQAYNSLASGKYFATITTPDVYVKFLNALVNEYVRTEKLSKDAATQKAKENLKVADLPRLPNSGKLTDTITDVETQTFAAKSMGGVNGYAISSYTKAPKACLLFIDFASKYDQVTKRAEKLGVVPARKDAAEAEGTNAYSEMVYQRVEENRIVMMPSVRDLTFVWSSVGSMFALVADDVTITGKGKPSKYATDQSLKDLLKSTVQDIQSSMEIG